MFKNSTLYKLILYTLVNNLFGQTLIEASSDTRIEQPIVIVVPSYNNIKWYERNLSSIFTQNYTNYKVIYTDDYSNDGTAQAVEQLVKKYGQENRFTLIKNNERSGALANLYRMIHSCDDQAIIATLDGDDWLPNNNTLQKLNAVYSTGDVWLTYGQFEIYPENIQGWCLPMPQTTIQKNSFRQFPNIPSHLRTFKAGLFKLIKLENLFYRGNFFPMTWDMATMLPMIEMAGERHYCFNEAMYIYNNSNPISDHRKNESLQRNLAKIIRAQKPYTRLPYLPMKEKQELQNKTANAIIISQNTPTHLEAFLNSLYTFSKGLGKLHILYTVEDPINLQKYQQLEEKFPGNYIKIADINKLNSYILSQLNSEYTLITQDNFIIKQSLILGDCIEALERTHSPIFYLDLAQDAHSHLSMVRLNNDIYALTVAKNYKKINYNILNHMALYKTCEIHLSPSNSLIFNKVYLCYENSKIDRLTSSDKISNPIT